MVNKHQSSILHHINKEFYFSQSLKLAYVISYAKLKTKNLNSLYQIISNQ